MPFESGFSTTLSSIPVLSIKSKMLLSSLHPFQAIGIKLSLTSLRHCFLPTSPVCQMLARLRVNL